MFSKGTGNEEPSYPYEIQVFSQEMILDFFQQGPKEALWKLQEAGMVSELCQEPWRDSPGLDARQDRGYWLKRGMQTGGQPLGKGIFFGFTVCKNS
jgi:hypothetical protein